MSRRTSEIPCERWQTVIVSKKDVNSPQGTQQKPFVLPPSSSSLDAPSFLQCLRSIAYFGSAHNGSPALQRPFQSPAAASACWSVPSADSPQGFLHQPVAVSLTRSLKVPANSAHRPRTAAEQAGFPWLPQRRTQNMRALRADLNAFFHQGHQP